MFKAKYFLNSSTLDDNVKVGGSYAWQSIMKARSVINLGSIWRFGDGKTVKIWRDNWFLDRPSSKIISLQKTLPNNSKVCALNNEEGLSWLEDQMTSEFLPHDS